MTFKEKIYHQHDVVCNQKYANVHPYSFHLECVLAQGRKFQHLIENELVVNPNNYKSVSTTTWKIVELILSSHDVCEDGRLTYNDLLDLVGEDLGNFVAAKIVADAVYCVTDEKGKTRAERKNESYYLELYENHLAIFVKLADIAANTLYSKLTGSPMYEKYKAEFPSFKKKVYLDKYEEFFDYVANL